MTAAFTFAGFTCGRVRKAEDVGESGMSEFAEFINHDRIKTLLSKIGEERGALFVSDIRQCGGDAFVNSVTTSHGCGVIEVPSCPSALKKVSPLELAFGLVRTWLKQHEEEAKDAPVKYIYKALDSVMWYEAFR